MNITQINHSDIFSNDKNQIIQKKYLFDLYSQNILIKSRKHDFNLNNVLNWFNFNLLTNYKTLDELALNISEDICILKYIQNCYRLVYIHVSFPNRWRPLEKINKNINEIHSPIPNFENTAIKIENFLKIMDENVPYRRENWGFSNSKDLYLPFEPTTRSSEKNDQDGIYLRREIQTLVKINNYIIFLIKTEIEKSDESKLKKLSSNLTHEMKDYKLLTSKL